MSVNEKRKFEDSTRNFIKHCKSKFRGSDENTRVIMDIGCGLYLFCAKAILAEYPNVESIIAIDRDPKIDDVELKNEKIKCHCADIEKRDTLEAFLGKVNKVFSIRVFQELTDIQTAFKNVYDLLRPGGEAAFWFYSRSSILECFVEMIKMPKWKDFYKRPFSTDSFLRGLSSEQYKEMLQKIGFQVVECFEKEHTRPFETDADCSDHLYKALKLVFKVPPELLDEFKQETLQVYEKFSYRDAQNRLVNISTDRTLLLVKPRDGDLK